MAYDRPVTSVSLSDSHQSMRGEPLYSLLTNECDVKGTTSLGDSTPPSNAGFNHFISDVRVSTNDTSVPVKVFRGTGARSE